MNKVVASGVTAIIIAIVLGFSYKQEIMSLVYDYITKDMYVSVDTDSFDPGPMIGDKLPTLTAKYKDKDVSSLSTFAGSKGTLLVISRSFDWCPFCMRQMIQLESYSQEFNDAGIGLVAITYDTPVLQQTFISQHNINTPILSDIDAKSFKALGILNNEYDEHSENYGIPYPGMILLDTHGTVVGKIFLEENGARMDALSALSFAKENLNNAQYF